MVLYFCVKLAASRAGLRARSGPPRAPLWGKEKYTRLILSLIETYLKVYISWYRSFPCHGNCPTHSRRGGAVWRSPHAALLRAQLLAAPARSIKRGLQGAAGFTVSTFKCESTSATSLSPCNPPKIELPGRGNDNMFEYSTTYPTVHRLLFSQLCLDLIVVVFYLEKFQSRGVAINQSPFQGQNFCQVAGEAGAFSGGQWD